MGCVDLMFGLVCVYWFVWTDCVVFGLEVGWWTYVLLGLVADFAYMLCWLAVCFGLFGLRGGVWIG